MNLENLMLSESSQSQKVNYLWFCLFEKSRIGKSTETESRLMLARCLRKEGDFVVCMEFSLGVMKIFWKLTEVSWHKIVNILMAT